jgi:hypothetical protein
MQVRGETVHQRYRQLLRAGFSAKDAASLIALADGIERHAEGEAPSGATWRWQEIARLEFLRFLVDAGRLRDELPTLEPVLAETGSSAFGSRRVGAAGPDTAAVGYASYR